MVLRLLEMLVFVSMACYQNYSRSFSMKLADMLDTAIPQEVLEMLLVTLLLGLCSYLMSFL